MKSTSSIRRSRRLVFLHLVQKLLDALDMFLRRIQREMHIRQAPQLQPLDQLAANKSCRMLQRLDCVALFLVRPFHADKHARMFHIRLYANLAHDNAAFEPRILQLARQHGVDLVRDLLAHPFVSMVCSAHLGPQRPQRSCESLRRAAAQTISNLSPIKNDPKISSALSKTFCNISRTCFSSFDNVTTPITDRCHTS